MTPHSHSTSPPIQLAASRTNSATTPCPLCKHGNKPFPPRSSTSIQVRFSYVITTIRLVVWTLAILKIQQKAWGRWQLLHKDGILYVLTALLLPAAPPHLSSPLCAIQRTPKTVYTDVYISQILSMYAPWTLKKKNTNIITKTGPK